jgi:hypothetical protein
MRSTRSPLHSQTSTLPQIFHARLLTHLAASHVYPVTEHHNVILPSTRVKSCSDALNQADLQKSVGIPRLKAATAKHLGIFAVISSLINGRSWSQEESRQPLCTTISTNSRMHRQKSAKNGKLENRHRRMSKPFKPPICTPSRKALCHIDRHLTVCNSYILVNSLSTSPTCHTCRFRKLRMTSTATGLLRRHSNPLRISLSCSQSSIPNTGT